MKLQDIFVVSPDTVDQKFENTPSPRPRFEPQAMARRNVKKQIRRPRCRTSIGETTENVVLIPAPKRENKAPRMQMGLASILPCFNVEADTLHRIDKSILHDVLIDKYNGKYDNFIVVDCRFDYEYKGGHISGAVNINSTDGLEEKFFKVPIDGETLVIFHCEFSAHRAPRMYVTFTYELLSINTNTHV